jgi:hypothetical protein
MVSQHIETRRSNPPNENHLVLQFAVLIKLGADPTWSAEVGLQALSVYLLPIEVQHLLDLLVP